MGGVNGWVAMHSLNAWAECSSRGGLWAVNQFVSDGVQARSVAGNVGSFGLVALDAPVGVFVGSF